MSCNCQNTTDFSLLEPCLEKYATVPGSLITILQNAQEIYGYLSVDVSSNTVGDQSGFSGSSGVDVI